MITNSGARSIDLNDSRTVSSERINQWSDWSIAYNN